MFTVYNDISSIQFENNLIGKIIETGIPKGFEKVVFELVTNKQGLLIPVSDKIKNDISISPNIASKENTVVFLYSKKESLVALNSGKTIHVKAGLNSLFGATSCSSPGDEKYNVKNLWTLNPEFSEASYKLSDKSPLKSQGTDNQDLGIISNN